MNIARLAMLATLLVIGGSAYAATDYQEALKLALNDGICVEVAVKDLVAENPDDAKAISDAADQVWPLYKDRPEFEKCTGNIALAAYQGGGDPQQVLTPTGAPANLGGIGGDSVSGGGFASPSTL